MSTGPFFLKSFIEVADGNEGFEYDGSTLLEGSSWRTVWSHSPRGFFQTRIIGLRVRSFLSAAIVCM